MAIRPPIVTAPTQNAEKLPATSPLSTFSDAPPSLLVLTTSRTWRLCTDVKTFVTSGMIAPASVPQVMIVASFHHSDSWPWMSRISRYEATYVARIEVTDAIQTSWV